MADKKIADKEDVAFTDPDDFARVVFLKTKNSEKCDSEVFAFFTDVKWNDTDYASYSHNGQHGPCSVDFAKECSPATEEEYEALERELRDVGYVLIVANAEEWLAALRK